MDVVGSRFRDQVGPWCLARDCDVPVIQCSGVIGLFDAAPDTEGKYSLTDTGGERLYARLLTTTQQFNFQGRMHRKHDSYCLKAKRLKKR